MFSPSQLLKKSASCCGEPGESCVGALTAWVRPAGVEHPTIRRIGWNPAIRLWPGSAPQRRSGTQAEVARHREELFAWAHAAWRAFFGPQLAAIVSLQRGEFDRRECHPYILGYVRGAIEQLVDASKFGHDLILASYIRIAALADVFGLDWVDHLDDEISDLGCGRLAPASTEAFEDGIEIGMSEMQSYLEGRKLEPKLLLVWFERTDREEVDRMVAASPAGRESAAVDDATSRTTGEPDGKPN